MTSRILQHDRLDGIHEVLTLIDRMFHFVVERVVFQEEDGVFLFGKKLSHKQPVQPIPFVFHFVNAYNMLAYGVIVHPPQQQYALMDFVNGSTDDGKKERRVVFDLVDPIKKQKVRHVVNDIENVVNSFREFVDVFSIKWRDERQVQFLEDPERQFIADMFQALDFVS